MHNMNLFLLQNPKSYNNKIKSKATPRQMATQGKNHKKGGLWVIQNKA